MTFVGLGTAAKFFAVVLWSALGVRVTTTTGESFEGELQEFGKDNLVVSVGGTSRELSNDAALSITRLKPKDDAVAPTTEVVLSNGCKIRVNEVTLADEKLKLRPRKQSSLELPLKSVKAIRFRPSSPTTDPQWLGLLANGERRDSLAIRRSGDQIDPATVVIDSIQDGKVGFNLDGQTAAAPIERLEGVVFGGSKAVDESAPIVVRDVYGSTWLVSELSSNNDLLKLDISGTEHEFPMEQIESIQWSSGLLLLASQQAASSSFSPYIETKLTDDKLSKWFGPTVAKQSNLVLVGGSSIDYRVDDGFSTLAGSVRRSPTVSKAGEVSLVIQFDGKEVWNQALKDTDSLGFEIKLNGAKRIRFLVDSGSDGDIGDTVHLSRPRLLK